MADLEKLMDQLSELTVWKLLNWLNCWKKNGAFPLLLPLPLLLLHLLPLMKKLRKRLNLMLSSRTLAPRKIETIKVIRQLTNLGLVDAKNMAESADSKILEAVGKDIANDAKEKLEAAGAEVELK